MTTSFGALCSDFYINSKIGVRMDLPTNRETVLDLFERLRRSVPDLRRFRRYEEELALESAQRAGGPQQWISLRRNNIRAGFVNPDSLEQAYALHNLIVQLAPSFLTINALDISHLEVVFGFDFETKGNHHAIIRDALLRGSPLAALADSENGAAINVSPEVGVSLTPTCEFQASFEVKARTSTSQVRKGRFREEAISVYVIVRRIGAPDDIRQLPEVFKQLTTYAEELSQEKALPLLIQPLRQTIASQHFE